MKTKLKRDILSPVQFGDIASKKSAPAPSINRARMVRYVGPVTRSANERALTSIEKLMNKSDEEIAFFITSTGGPTGTAMSFFDTIRHVLKPNLVTIGSGDVDSSGILLFLVGDRRYITARTTLLLHPAGRIFNGNQRYTTVEMEAMLAEDRLKDEQYATLVAERSKGKLRKHDVLQMMMQHTILKPADLIAYGLADAVLP